MWLKARAASECGALADSGTLTISDADTGENVFQTSGITASSGALGNLTITTAGVWSYTVANADVQYLKAGETKTETFTVKAADGTTKDVVVTITGTKLVTVVPLPNSPSSLKPQAATVPSSHSAKLE